MRNAPAQERDILTPRQSKAVRAGDAVDVEMPLEMAAMFAPPETPSKDDDALPPASLQSLFQPLSPRADDLPPQAPASNEIEMREQPRRRVKKKADKSKK